MPEVLPPHRLPKVFDPRRILADEQVGQILHRTNDAARMPFQRRFAPAEQSWLIGNNFHEHPIPHASVTNERFYGSDFHMLPSLMTLPQGSYGYIIAMPNRLTNNGRARLLPSWRRNGSAGAVKRKPLAFVEKFP